jgi:hypothetical protein
MKKICRNENSPYLCTAIQGNARVAKDLKRKGA